MYPKLSMKRPRIAAFILLTAASAMPTLAQPAVDLPRQSPAATVSQTFGYTTATVSYARPAVNGRVIWGGLVPYGHVWRAGANEPTTVTFTRDVTVNGQPLVAGAYALFILPEQAGTSGKTDTWTFIFSRNTKGWGAYGYDAKDDALRVTVPPAKAAHAERLTVSFDELHDGGATLTVHWEKLRASLTLEAEFVETAKANIAKGLPKAGPNDVFAWMHSARFTWEHAANGAEGDADRAQALEWVDRSIAIRPMFPNLWLKARMVAAAGRCDEARALLEQARAAAGEDVSQLSQLPDAKSARKWCGK